MTGRLAAREVEHPLGRGREALVLRAKEIMAVRVGHLAVVVVVVPVLLVTLVVPQAVLVVTVQTGCRWAQVMLAAVVAGAITSLGAQVALAVVGQAKLVMALPQEMAQ
jgi:hypothetical protein